MALAADEKLTIIPVLLEDCEPSGAGKFIVAGLQRIEGRKRSVKAIAGDISKVVSGGEEEVPTTVDGQEDG